MSTPERNVVECGSDGTPDEFIDSLARLIAEAMYKEKQDEDRKASTTEEGPWN